MSWYFERLIPSDTILAVEPDGTRHCVMRGDHLALYKLLNRMAEALSRQPMMSVIEAHAALRHPDGDDFGARLP
jgi:hypothetical protein